MKIEGVPEGWELVRIGPLYSGQPCQYIDWEGNIETHDGKDYMCEWAPIVKKIEKPKRYRPFASAEEFKPHRDRWIDAVDKNGCWRVCAYSDTHIYVNSYRSVSYVDAFGDYVFDDGTPFGIEVTE